MNLRQIQDIAGHRDVPPWVVKLVQDCIEHDRMYENNDLTIAHMVGFEKGKDYMREKAARVCEEFTADMRHQSKEVYSFALNCAAAIRGMKLNNP